ncbi:MAG TPA: hypothetical protein VI670_20155 [Thermoanaerobaculia bacterium]
MDLLLITDANRSLRGFGDHLSSAGWNVGQARPGRLVVSKGYPETGDEYVAIEEADEIRREFEDDEWKRVTDRIESPHIFYLKYRDRQLIREVLKTIVDPGMLIDENDNLIAADDFT